MRHTPRKEIRVHPAGVEPKALRLFRLGCPTTELQETRGS